MALGAGVITALLPARVVALVRSLGAWPSGAVVALLAFLIVQAADPFAGARSWRYAPDACDLAVEFPHRPAIVAGEALNDARQASAVERALLTDLARATSYSAECVGLGRVIEPADRARLLADAEARLKRDAERLRIKIGRLAREGESRVILHGVSDEGRNAANVPLIRRAQARVVLGRSSVLMLWTWTVLLGGEGMPVSVEGFHTSVRPAVPAAP